MVHFFSTLQQLLIHTHLAPMLAASLISLMPTSRPEWPGCWPSNCCRLSLGHLNLVSQVQHRPGLTFCSIVPLRLKCSPKKPLPYLYPSTRPLVATCNTKGSGWTIGLRGGPGGLPAVEMIENPSAHSTVNLQHNVKCCQQLCCPLNCRVWRSSPSGRLYPLSV